METILEKIHTSGLKFLEPLNPGETYRTIVEEAAKLIGADSVALYLAQQDGSHDNKRLVKVSTYPQELIRLIEPRSKGYTYKSYKERRAFVIHTKEINKIHPEFKENTPRSILFIPISYHQKSWGTLNLVTYGEKKYSQRELRILKVFGSYASMAIRKAQVHEELKAALTQRDQFISMAAHELRTPITAISGYIQLLYTKSKKLSTTEARWIEQLSNENQRLTNLVNELLEISRIKTNRLHYFFQECSLRKIVDRAISNFIFLFPDRQVTLTDQIGKNYDIVVGDFDKLLQVIGNLLENAAKFSNPDTKIALTLKSQPPYLIISIQDQGLGIAKKDLARIFESFYRGGNAYKEGMGLGLFLAKSIIDYHKGILNIKSKLSKGTTVEIKLPKHKHGNS